jgi:hypothetical protein
LALCAKQGKFVQFSNATVVGKAAKDKNGKRLPFYRFVRQQSELLLVINRTTAWQWNVRLSRYFISHVCRKKIQNTFLDSSPAECLLLFHGICYVIMSVIFEVLRAVIMTMMMMMVVIRVP